MTLLARGKAWSQQRPLECRVQQHPGDLGLSSLQRSFGITRLAGGPRSRCASLAAIACTALLATLSYGQDCGAGEWEEVNPRAGIFGNSVSAMKWWDPDGAGPRGRMLVVGGEFSQVGDAPARNIAIWDPATKDWEPLGSGLDRPVRAITVDASGALIVGGSSLLPSVEGGLVSVARWTGAEWLAVGSGLNGTVLALTTTPLGEVVAGGDFTSVQTSTVSSGVRAIARWNGTSWSAMTTQLGSSIVWTLGVLASGELIAGGTITNGGLRNLVTWNGTGWQTFRGGVDGTVRSLTVDGQNRVLLGGTFLNAGNAQFPGGGGVLRVARWSGLAWERFGTSGPTGLAAEVRSVEVLEDGKIVAGGVEGVSVWDGLNWRRGSLNLYSPSVSVIARLDTDRFVVGGMFSIPTVITPLSAPVPMYENGIMVGDGQAWSSTVNAAPVNRYLSGAAENAVFALSRTGRSTLATRNAGLWAVVPQALNGAINRGLVLNDGTIVATGAFTETWTGVSGSGQPLLGIAKWNGASWSPFGPGFDPDPDSPIQTTDGNDVIALGTYVDPVGTETTRVARWNNGVWTPIGGVIGPAGARATQVAVLPTGEIVLVGEMTSIGQTIVQGPILWSGSSWSSLGAVSGGSVTCLTAGRSRTVVIGGSFNTVNGVATDRVAIWSDGNWSGLAPIPVGGEVRAVGLSPQSDPLVVACEVSGTSVVARVLRHQTSGWLELASWSSSRAFDATFDSNGDLWINGNFIDLDSRRMDVFARWTARPIIEVSPESIGVCVGDRVQLEVRARSAGGNSQSLQYQWLKDGAPIDQQSNPSAATRTLEIASARPEDAGQFSCAVSDACGSRLSGAAVLAVGRPDCPRQCDSLDFNGDGMPGTVLDVDAYFSVLGDGPCLPVGENCGDLDFNNDGLIDPTDVDAYFSILGDGPCLP